MKRIALSAAVLGIAVWCGAQTTPGTQQNPPAAGQATPGQATPAGQATPLPGATTPPAKRPPQAKTQPEFDAYKAAAASADTATLEKAADDFATKFPDSELRLLLYKQAMRTYQSANNGDKTDAMGRKVLSLDGDDPEALVIVAEVIAEKTHDSDLDKEQRFDEAMKMAQKATQTVETDISVNPGTPQDKIDAYKSLLRSNAYSIIGTIEFKKDSFAAAQESLQKSIDAYPAQPDPVVVLRLALSLDKQAATLSTDKQAAKYTDALKVANRAVELTQESTQIGTLARRERDRLQQLTGGTATPSPAQPPKN
jgi:tetratricopeptide (TPR) repeat protein